jgi:hypothetical protein
MWDGVQGDVAWFKERFGVQIGSKHQLKCALIFEDAINLKEMQADAELLFRGIDVCPGLMMLHV